MFKNGVGNIGHSSANNEPYMLHKNEVIDLNIKCKTKKSQKGNTRENICYI